MKLAALSIFLFLVVPSGNSQASVEGLTPTRIPLDSDWKAQEYNYALKNVVHPSWGIAHSERDYQVAKQLAEDEHISMDLDVLFAAAFLHDLGGIGSFAKPGVDHAVRSAELAEPLLRDWGFPMSKWPQVKDMILGHTYYGPLPVSQPALAFRDADILDFLGDIGIARIFAITEESGRSSPTLASPVTLLKEFRKDFPGKLSLKSSLRYAQPRLDELDAFLKVLNAETFGECAL